MKRAVDGGREEKPCLVEFGSSFILILSSILTTVLVALNEKFFFYYFFFLNNLASDFGFNFVSYSVVFCTTSVNS
jgi:predicted membrane channel-forming protein YqfA (hemolysin III family)